MLRLIKSQITSAKLSSHRREQRREWDVETNDVVALPNSWRRWAEGVEVKEQREDEKKEVMEVRDREG